MRFLAFIFIFVLSGCAIYSEQAGWGLYRMGFYETAISNWREAAKRNDAGAAFRYASALLDGVVVKRNPKEAVRWLKRSASLGDARAQQELGTLYDQGQAGLPKSYRIAAEYYLAAARSGLPEAQYNIAVMYELGHGIDQDYTSAYMFYTLAIRNDFATFAQPARERLSYRMARAQIELAKMRAAAFKNKDHAGLGGL